LFLALQRAIRIVVALERIGCADRCLEFTTHGKIE
jgi:hypothetical protein